MLRDVVALAYDGVGSLGLGVVSEVFGYDRTVDGLPGYDFAVVSERPGRVRTDTGLLLHVEHGWSAPRAPTWSSPSAGRTRTSTRRRPTGRCCGRRWRAAPG